MTARYNSCPAGLDARPDLPIILLTGFSEKLQGRSREELGIEDLLSKPVNTADLAAAIHTAFNRNRTPDR